MTNPIKKILKIKINFSPPAPLFSKTADAKLNIYFVQPYDFNTKVLTWLLIDRGYGYENIYQAKLNVLVVKGWQCSYFAKGAPGSAKSTGIVGQISGPYILLFSHSNPCSCVNTRMLWQIFRRRD